jgi:hypothetical protein
VKLARKKGIPYFEPPIDLNSVPLEVIECPVIPLLTLKPMANPMEAEIKRFGKYWDDNFQWDLVSKRVAEVRMSIEDPKKNSSQKTQYWKTIMNTEFKSIVQHRIGKEMVALVRQQQRVEWDRRIVSFLQQRRARDNDDDLV